MSGISFTTSIQTLESYCLGTFLAKEFINIFILSWSQCDFYPLISLITSGDIHSFQTSCLDNKIHCSIIQNSHKIHRFIIPSVFVLTSWLIIIIRINEWSCPVHLCQSIYDFIDVCCIFLQSIFPFLCRGILICLIPPLPATVYIYDQTSPYRFW